MSSFSGVKAFTLPLSSYVRSGKWLLHVEVELSEFSTAIEVAPGIGGGYPDVAAAEEHYVELRFGKEMRRRYKPGLPFSGKVSDTAYKVLLSNKRRNNSFKQKHVSSYFA